VHDDATLKSVLPSLGPGQNLAGYLWRATNLEKLFGFHATTPYLPQPLYSPGGPMQRGQRFTPPGGPRSLYMGEDMLTAYAESNRIAAAFLTQAHQLLPPKPPTVLFLAEFELKNVLDATLPAVQNVLGTSDAELKQPWRRLKRRRQPVPTWRLGQAVFNSGLFDGMRYPSANRQDGVCIVVFVGRLKKPASFVRVYDPDKNLKQRLP